MGDGATVIQNRDIGGRQIGQRPIVLIGRHQREPYLAYALAQQWGGLSREVGSEEKEGEEKGQPVSHSLVIGTLCGSLSCGRKL
jgi:hypothetical protein